MAASTLTPYELLGANPSDNDLHLRLAYRARIHEFKEDRLKGSRNRKITAEKFRLICRAYETLSDYEKRERYDQRKEWIFNLPLTKYTLQQLAAEPDLASELKNRLQNATVRKINEQDPVTGHTPLYCAARACNIDAVYYLTEQGAEPDLWQKRGSTALHVSAFYGHQEIVRCMLESGADYRIKNSYGNSAETEVFENDVEVKRAFIELKEEPFVQAAADQLDWFKENNISQHIDEQYYRQRHTLLHCACKKGYANLARWLIEERSANLDIVDINLNSALHLAAYGGHAAIVKYLLNRGANPLLINKWGMTAEQEGITHGTTISELFQAIRKLDMFEMAANDVEWWFKYHFGENSPNAVNKAGATLLYIACRCGQTSVAKWLLENGADVDLQISSDSRSTPLHGAVYHGHLSTVELLLAHGADMNIKNQFGETVFENARSDEVKRLLGKKRQNFQDNKFITVHLFGDGKSTGNEALAKIQLNCDSNYNDLVDAMPAALKAKYTNFSIARRPLVFDGDATVLSAVCRARYGKTKFVELPLCITAHEKARYTQSGHVVSNELPTYNLREFQGKFMSKCETSKIKIKAHVDKTQTFTFGNLSFTFAANCVEEDLSIEIQYIFSPKPEICHLPECVCLFQTRYSNKGDKLNEMPIVSFNHELNARLYNWIQPSAYWFAYSTRHIRLPFIGSVHAFVRHVDIFQNRSLRLPPDMFIQAAVGKPFISRQTPVPCQCLKIREHNTKDFPRIAYHGTSIQVIPSILMDGLVMPSTVVSNGLRVCPPDNHIARGVKAFEIDDFSNGIFLSPSIYYCSDPAYAVTFSNGDQQLIAVLECSVKDGAYGSFKSTVPGYVPHPDDDIDAMEWRFTNPAAIEINSILFISVIESRAAAALLWVIYKRRPDKIDVFRPLPPPWTSSLQKNFRNSIFAQK